MIRKIFSSACLVLVTLALSGCSYLVCAKKQAPPPKKTPAPKEAVSSPAPKEAVSSDVMIYPDGCGACGVLRVEKSIPSEVSVGQPFDYQIKVTNISDYAVSDVMVTDEMPGNYKVISSRPEAVAGSGPRIMKWDLDSMAPGESKFITVSGSVSEVGEFEYCGTASFQVPYCVNTKAIQPELDVAATGPAKVLVCDEILVNITATNPGTGTARDVVVKAALPQGMRTTDGKSTVMFPSTDMASGQQQQLSLLAKAEKTGTYNINVSAQGAGGLSAEAEPVKILVQQPVLKIAKTAPEIEWIGRPFTSEISLSNTGDATSQNTVVVDRLPTGVRVQNASQGGVVSGDSVTWNLGALAPNASRKMAVTLISDTQGIKKNTASASGDCAAPVSDTASTNIKGIAAILLEVIDVKDPIAVGDNETYVIVVTNQGSATDTNIQIACTMEEEQSYVSSSGATSAIAEGRNIKFAPLPRLAPNEKAEWRVVVKAEKTGDIRFTVKMTSDQLTRPVQENEATHQYQ